MTQIETVAQFQKRMYQIQAIRRKIVASIWQKVSSPTPVVVAKIPDELMIELRTMYDWLTDSNTNLDAYTRRMQTAQSEIFEINIKDEIIGLRKDLQFLDDYRRQLNGGDWVVDIVDILAPYHPNGERKFRDELEQCVKFLTTYIDSSLTENRKPIFITDWDGTMKDYCSQYATNLQPIYSAISMAGFAAKFTRLSAVLTAGPLRGPGILDLTALPIDGPVVFSGSWGREWWMHGRRVVHEDGITDEGFDALQRFADEMSTLLESADYSRFSLVGSGVQRKVDRYTLGVQSVCGQVDADLVARYQDAVIERIHRVDPYSRVLSYDPSTHLEVEVVVHTVDGTVWNKGDGVDRIVESVGDTLAPPGRVLICGDTRGDLPMVRRAVDANPSGAMALFVGADDELQRDIDELLVAGASCFVTCPDVIHAAMAILLRERSLILH